MLELSFHSIGNDSHEDERPQGNEIDEKNLNSVDKKEKVETFINFARHEMSLLNMPERQSTQRKPVGGSRGARADEMTNSERFSNLLGAGFSPRHFSLDPGVALKLRRFLGPDSPKRTTSPGFLGRAVADIPALFGLGESDIPTITYMGRVYADEYYMDSLTVHLMGHTPDIGDSYSSSSSNQTLSSIPEESTSIGERDSIEFGSLPLVKTKVEDTHFSTMKAAWRKSGAVTNLALEMQITSPSCVITPFSNNHGEGW